MCECAVMKVEIIVAITLLAFCFVSESAYNCKNKKVRGDCTKHAARGRCIGPPRWKAWMMRNCKRTCGCDWCMDVHTGCTHNKRFCESKVASQRKWMFKNCRKTCGCQLVSNCGIQGTPASHSHSSLHALLVVGGNDVIEGEYPWHVGIWHKPNTGQDTSAPFCSGTLLSHNIIVTAAHCFTKSQDPEKYFVKLGDLIVNHKDSGEKIHSLKKIILHRYFNTDTFANDIALIILKERVKRFTKYIRPACIPETSQLPHACWVTGWGQTTEDGERANVLQHLEIPIVANHKCNRAYEEHFPYKQGHIILNTMICAGYDEGERDACNYDSGGPLSCQVNGRYVLSGIVSWGRGCARAKSYGVYTNVFNYIHWIRKKLRWQF